MVPGLFEDGKYFTLNSSSPYIGDGDAVLVGMPRLRQLRVKEGIFKKLYPRRPKNAAWSAVNAPSIFHEANPKF